MSFPDKCDHCGFHHYRTDPCRGQRSTAVRKDVQATEVRQRPAKAGESQNNAVSPKDRDMADHTAQAEETASGFRAPSVDTHSKAKFDKRAYQRRYMREVYRPKIKAKLESNA